MKSLAWYCAYTNCSKKCKSLLFCTVGLVIMCRMLGVTQGRKDIFSNEKVYTSLHFVFAAVPLHLFVSQGPGNQHWKIYICLVVFKISSTINLVNSLHKTLPKSISTAGFTLIERDPEAQPYK